ncbi:hypothetical protein [Actinopolymorpha alba]|uniref:hypothetical protein n=1 Tax=Actinopolymorpha alba TaxID=533267 RepID=UPI000375B627|nr:hypothetical protein [Actinopolymorpha alba]
MDLLRLLGEPRKLLGGVTVIFAVAAGLWAFGQSNGDLPPSLILLVPVVVLSVLGWKHEKAGRGWLYLLVAWGLGFIAYGALFPTG